MNAPLIAALKEIMVHVSRCPRQLQARGYSANCTDPEHAIEILDRHAIVATSALDPSEPFQTKGVDLATS